MLDALIAAAVLTVICAAGMGLIMWESERRWRKMKVAFEEQWKVQEADARAQPQPAPVALDLPAWQPWRPDSAASAKRLEQALATLDATAVSGATDDEEDVVPPAPAVPIDLGDLAHRLSDAGYDGGPLRLAGVEVQPDRRVVVHLEPQGP